MDASLRAAMGPGERLVGTWVTVGHPAVAEVAAGTDCDFVVLEGEHAPNGLGTLADLVRGVEAAAPATPALVRANDARPSYLKRVADLGVDGVMVPMVESADDAEQVVAATRYPPGGVRGLGGHRGTDYGADVEGYLRRVDASFLRIAQIETAEGVENAREIVGVDGVHALFVGPADLSLSLGRYGAWDDGAFRDAVDRVVAAAHDAGVAVGTVAGTSGGVPDRLDWGVDFLVAGVDTAVLRAGLEEAVATARDGTP